MKAKTKVKAGLLPTEIPGIIDVGDLPGGLRFAPRS
jgi:hypothetical protein